MDKKLNIGNKGSMEVKAPKPAAAGKKPVKKTGGDLRCGK